MSVRNGGYFPTHFNPEAKFLRLFWLNFIPKKWHTLLRNHWHSLLRNGGIVCSGIVTIAALEKRCTLPVAYDKIGVEGDITA